jgi:hypothetical protein
LLRASDIIVFIGVDGAVQQGLSTTGTLLILVLFTSCFLLMFVCLHFFPILPTAVINAQL